MVNQVEALRDADLVIEAVVEKKKLNSLYLSNSLKFVVRNHFASNTSSISVTAISAGIAHPERVVGLHFLTLRQS